MFLHIKSSWQCVPRNHQGFSPCLLYHVASMEALGHLSSARGLREHGEQCGRSLGFHNRRRCHFYLLAGQSTTCLSPLKLSQLWRPGSPRLKALADWMSGDSFTLVHSRLILLCPHIRKVEEFLCLFLHKRAPSSSIRSLLS